MNLKTFRRARIRALMGLKLLTTKALADEARMSLGHCYNLIAGVDTSAPGRQRIESVLGASIWPNDNDAEAEAKNHRRNQQEEN